MSNNKANIVIPPAAGYLLYKAYKSGTFDSLKDKLFGNPQEDVDPSPYGKEDLDNTSMLGASVPHGSAIPIQIADTIHGKEAQNVVFDPSVYQYYNDTCAIQSQHLILEQYGIHVSQEDLIQIAKENGWYAEGYGTPMEMTGKLLEYFGIDVTGSQGNNIFNLANEIAQGHQVIVGVDSGELVYPEETKDFDVMYGEQADHALVVVGIDTSDPDNVMVIVTDPGTGNRQMAYPAEQFVDAWKDSNCFMVTTNNIPTEPIWDYTPINEFAGIPMDSLNRLSNMDIDISSTEEYDHFVEDLLADPSSFEELLTQYADLFDCMSEEDL